MIDSHGAVVDERTDALEPQSEPRKPYVPPAITHELSLETRAGSPIGFTNPFSILLPPKM